MKRLLLLLLFPVATMAQVPEVIKLQQLQDRISAAGDTVLVVNFWATWCVPCVKELPAFDSISRKYASQKVRVLLVSLDFREDMDSKVKPFLAKRELHPQVLLLDETNANKFIPAIYPDWTGAIPATLISRASDRRTVFHEKKLTYAALEESLSGFLPH